MIPINTPVAPAGRHAEREALAQRVADAFHAAFAKLAEHKEDIEQLWREFEHLKPGETIMQCRTKTEYCQKVLHRSIRAAQYMLTGGNPVAKRKRETVSRATPAITPKQRDRLLSAAAIVGTELIPAFDHDRDLSAPIAQLRKIAFDSAELYSIVESQNALETENGKVRTLALQLARKVLLIKSSPEIQELASQLIQLLDPTSKSGS